uniref:RNA-directed DNA polymerase, eukaryota, reverse transcriptase zinc-binding domain protein n=1 Tax=Tanacetum cinerariifolium TaxID=118510 RepID=A0A6L2J1E6_TANCI|nr:RNA-directed DNA polymerase, eukaryota, reverse transcriptase zinc-binding domain protein [Tanacetum cinerariifolium]
MEECPNMVLDETCLNHEDFLLCLLRKVKEFASITNLKVVLDEKVIWVKVEGVACKWWSRNTFSRIASRWGTLLNGEELEKEGYHSNRICIHTKLKTIVFDSFKMVYRGMTCWVRAIEVPGWVPDFEEDDVEGESDREEVHETNFEEVPDKSIFEGNSVRKNDVHSEDPFGIYEVLNKKRDGKNIDDMHADSLKYLPGFTPNEEGDVPVEKVDNYERFGSIFNKHGAEAFNSFIINAGLVEVPLGGSSFTWCHKSGKKMSKLDRFLISDNLMCSCPSISSTSLDRFLSDHRPIIMREAHYDYEPIPFKFFYYWFKLDGFDKREVVRLIQEVEKVDAMEVAQKAKSKWSIEGDENLKFEKPNKSRVLLERDFVKKNSLEQNDDMEREVSNEEIKKAVWDCGIDKAPGPMVLLLVSIDGIGTLLVPNANMVKDFRPVSLIRSVYKVIAKVLANHLVTVLDDIVDEIQSAFVTDRQIMDGPFILNDIVHWCENKKKQSMIFKVDFEKAYDSVRLDFYDDMLRRFGFGEKWCKWIQSCHYSSKGSVLVNGSLTKEFQFHKGLFNGIKLDSSLQISHVFYADDAIFIGQWSQCNIDTIIRVLDVFYHASGLRINMNKINLMGIFVDSNKVKHAAAKIGCLVFKMPFNYLASRVGDLMSRIQSWRDVIEGMHTRLSKWKLKTLSIGGRLTLLKSVLGTTPIYQMSIFKVSMKVLQNMESIRARFFNGAHVNSKKPSWVRWKSALAAKDVGGLGVSGLFALNRALMFKWVWRFFSQKNSLWVRVVKALRGEDGKIGKKVQPRYPSTSLNIINEIESLKLHGIDLVSFITSKLGNGVNTLFWDAAWCADIAFKNLVSRLYALESMKNIEVASKLSHGGVTLSNSNDRWSWSLVGSGDFLVSSVKKLFDNTILLKGISKTRWTKEVPINISRRGRSIPLKIGVNGIHCC